MKRIARFCTFVVASAALASACLTASYATGLVSRMGQWGGKATAVAVSGDRAYLGMGCGMLIVDVSNPSAPTPVGNSDSFASPVKGVAVSGDYAYVADGAAGLIVVDVSDPVFPKQITSLPMANACGVAISGSRAYVAGGTAGFFVVDISDPAQPVIAGSCNMACTTVSIADSRAYVSNGAAGVGIADISDPTRPRQIGWYNDGEVATGIAASGRYAYAVYQTAGLQIIDVSSTVWLGCKGRFASPGLCGVAINGQYAYLAGGSGLQIVDVSNPISPTLVGSVATDGACRAMAISGSHAFFAADVAGLDVADISNLSSPQLVGRYATGDVANAVAVVDNYVYVAEERGGLYVLDATNQTLPVSKGLYPSLTRFGNVAADGNYAVTTGSCGTLDVFDISDRLHPQKTGTFGEMDGFYGVAITGTTIYAAGSPGLCIIDISNPASPTLVGRYSTTSVVYDVAVWGNYAYLAAGDDGLKIVNVSNPASPTLAGSYDTPGTAYGVASYRNTFAYIADGTNGLVVLEVSNPASPTLYSAAKPGGTARDVALWGIYACVADDSGGLQVMDAFDPGTALWVARYQTIGTARSVTASGNYVYATDDGNGVVVLRIGDGRPTISAASPASASNAASAATIMLTGSDFVPGAVVKLTRASQPNVPASKVAVLSQTSVRCTFDLRGLPLGAYNIALANPRGGDTALANGFTVTDGVVPVIHGVTATPALAAAGDIVKVQIDASDDTGVGDIVSVTANSKAIPRIGRTTWSGQITAAAEISLHNVNVAVRDVAGNSATDASASYRTARVVGLPTKGLSHSMMGDACGFYIFRTWGRVQELNDNEFTLSDGSGATIRVYAPGYKAKIAANDYASARGMLKITTDDSWIESTADWVTKY